MDPWVFPLASENYNLFLVNLGVLSLYMTGSDVLFQSSAVIILGGEADRSVNNPLQNCSGIIN